MEQRYGACAQRVDGNGLGAIDCPVHLGVPRDSVGGRALIPMSWDPSNSVFEVVKGTGDDATTGLFGIKGLIFYGELFLCTSALFLYFAFS